MWPPEKVKACSISGLDAKFCDPYNAAKADHLTQQTALMNKLFDDEITSLTDEKANGTPSSPHEQNFNKIRQEVWLSIENALPIPLQFIQPGNGQAQKTMLQPRVAFPDREGCTIFGAGLASESDFEQQMSQYCPVRARGTGMVVV